MTIEVWPDAARFPHPFYLGFGAGDLPEEDPLNPESIPSTVRYEYPSIYAGLEHSLKIELPSFAVDKKMIGPLLLGPGNWVPGTSHWFGMVASIDGPPADYDEVFLVIKHRGYSLANPYAHPPLSVGTLNGQWYCALGHNPISYLDARQTQEVRFDLGPVDGLASFLVSMRVSAGVDGRTVLFMNGVQAVTQDGPNYFVGEQYGEQTGLYQAIGIDRKRMSETDISRAIDVYSMIYADANHEFNQIYAALIGGS